MTSESGRFGWEDWDWDASLFEGSAQYYRRGRIPYSEGLVDSLAAVLELDGDGRLLDVGCGADSMTGRTFWSIVGLPGQYRPIAVRRLSSGRTRDGFSVGTPTF